MFRRLRIRSCLSCRSRFRRLGRCRAVCWCLFGTVCLLISLSCFSYVFRHELFDTFGKCSEAESVDYIDSYCQMFKEGKINGSLCHPLCITHTVNFHQCTNFHAGKRVNVMTCTDYCFKGQTVLAVLKSPTDDHLQQFATLPDITDEQLKEEDVPTVEKFIEAQIHNRLVWEFGFVPFSSDQDVIGTMWERNYRDFMRTHRDKRVAFKTILLLLDQSEYKAAKALESSHIIPLIYGTCGPLYLQEYCAPGVLDDSLIVMNHKSSPPTWHEKATTTLKLLQLLHKLDVHYPQMLHQCDVKGSNFGNCMDGSVKLIDADNLFFHSKMLETMNMSTCVEHSDCNFFDCGGWCQLKTGQCHAVITNNNLQSVCDDILSGRIARFFNWGLFLSGAPPSVQNLLDSTVNECLQQTSEVDDIPMYKPSAFVWETLHRLLENSLGEPS